MAKGSVSGLRDDDIPQSVASGVADIGLYLVSQIVTLDEAREPIELG